MEQAHPSVASQRQVYPGFLGGCPSVQSRMPSDEVVVCPDVFVHLPGRNIVFHTTHNLISLPIRAMIAFQHVVVYPVSDAHVADVLGCHRQIPVV